MDINAVIMIQLVLSSVVIESSSTLPVATPILKLPEALAQQAGGVVDVNSFVKHEK
jgi:hypothetical protein